MKGLSNDLVEIVENMNEKFGDNTHMVLKNACEIFFYKHFNLI